MKSQYEGTCPVCSSQWKINDEIFLSKVNGSWIKCIDKECFQQQGGKIEQPKSKFQSSKFPITEAPKIFTIAEELLESFKTKRGIQHEGSPSKLTISEEAQTLASIFHSLSLGYKP